MCHCVHVWGSELRFWMLWMFHYHLRSAKSSRLFVMALCPHEVRSTITVSIHTLRRSKQCSWASGLHDSCSSSNSLDLWHQKRGLHTLHRRYSQCLIYSVHTGPHVSTVTNMEFVFNEIISKSICARFIKILLNTQRPSKQIKFSWPIPSQSGRPTGEIPQANHLRSSFAVLIFLLSFQIVHQMINVIRQFDTRKQA